MKGECKVFFTVWLAEHKDDEGAVGRLAKQVQRDVGRNCMPAPLTVDGVHQHLLDKHPGSKNFDEVIDDLTDAEEAYFLEYEVDGD